MNIPRSLRSEPLNHWLGSSIFVSSGDLALVLDERAPGGVGFRENMLERDIKPVPVSFNTLTNNLPNSITQYACSTTPKTGRSPLVGRKGAKGSSAPDVICVPQSCSESPEGLFSSSEPKLDGAVLSLIWPSSEPESNGEVGTELASTRNAFLSVLLTSITSSAAVQICAGYQGTHPLTVVGISRNLMYRVGHA